MAERIEGDVTEVIDRIECREIKIVKRPGLASRPEFLQALPANAVGYAIPPARKRPQQKDDSGLTSL
jgi:hypothetical protein